MAEGHATAAVRKQRDERAASLGLRLWDLVAHVRESVFGSLSTSMNSF